VLEDLRWDDHELLARIAHRSYKDGRTQEEIAHEFGLSRPKVQRLLERARSSGVVDIHIEVPAGLNLELEKQLVDTFRLADAIVSPDRTDPDSQREAVARSAARYLERRLYDGAVVAVSHGRDIGEVSRFFRSERRVDCVFASAMGGSPRVDTPTNPNEICRALAEKCGGRAASLYAPAYVESAEVRDSLLEQEAVRQTLDVAARASMALVGVGGTDDGCTMVRSGCLSLAEIARLRDQGAVGDVLGNYVDVEGRLIAAPHSDRLIALSIDDLHRMETVIAVASEAEKPVAILGVLRAGVVDVLIVDEGNASAVLRLAHMPQSTRVDRGGDPRRPDGRRCKV
jgi:Transcriptional regulator, contains sigma factor-related N-terminal domain